MTPPRILINHSPELLGGIIAEWIAGQDMTPRDATSYLHGSALAYAFLLEINGNQASFNDAVTSLMGAGSQCLNELERRKQ